LTGKYLYFPHRHHWLIEHRADAPGGNAMTIHWIEILAAVSALGLFVYLGYALLRPEKF
jgi:K+-transporting ATPase KdpF subunit